MQCKGLHDAEGQMCACCVRACAYRCAHLPHWPTREFTKVVFHKPYLHTSVSTVRLPEKLISRQTDPGVKAALGVHDKACSEF